MKQLADDLTAFFAARGCVIPEIGLLQPADPLLETAGEDLRRRIFITADQHGAGLCLRPEFTVPVCLHHLRGAGGKARYGYAGTVFRQRLDEPAEFMQAGIEDIGEQDRVAADVAAISDCVEALRRGGVADLRLVIGDQALFEAVLAALDLPRAWQKRLGRAFGDTARLRDDIERLSADNEAGTGISPEQAGGLVASGDSTAVRGWVEERMKKAGLPPAGGRTAAEITTRAMEKAELAATRLDAAHREALDAFLAIDVAVRDAPALIAATASEHNLAIDTAVAQFNARVEAMEAAGLTAGDVVYRAAFGRRLDYYTGLVFEITADGPVKPIAGGGRYDRLMSLLGAEAAPAVGFSIWLDRLELARRNVA